MMDKRPSHWLSDVARDESVLTYTSQRGEDRILQKIFEIIGVDSKWCVEFGAADGKRGSNTWYFIDKQNWHAVQIEPKHDKDLNLTQKRDTYEALEERYGKNNRVTCIDSVVMPSGAKSLDKLLAGTKIPKEFDLLSIDVDSVDYAIWESLQEYKPRVVVVEHNKTIPVEIDFYSDRGSSLRAFSRLAKEKGYELVAATIVNGIFVKEEYFPQFEIEDNDPAQIWTDHAQYRKYMWQLYDGTIIMQGDNKLRWTRGVDGTVAGQIRAGKFQWLKAGVHSLKSNGDVDSSFTTQPLLSGRIRALLYQLIRKV